MFANVNQMTAVSGGLSQQVTDRWREAIQHQPGFVGFLTLAEQEHPARQIIVTLWESAEAARGWNQNPVFARMREEELGSAISDWSVTPTEVVAAELRDIVV